MAEAVTTTPAEKKADVFGLLKSNSAFRLLWLSRIVSVVGSSLSLVTLLLYTATATGSGMAVALLMLVSDLAPTLLSPFLGTLSDRVNRKRVMVLCELGQGMLFASIAFFTPPLPILLIMIGVHTIISHLFGTASRSVVPDLIKDEDLESANAALGLGSTSLELVGPLLAAVLLPFFSLSELLFIDAITYVISGLLLLKLPQLLGTLPKGERRSFLSDVKEGLHIIWSNHVVRVIVIGFFTVVSFTAIDDVALVFLAKDSLGATDSSATILYAGAGFGLLLGFVVLSKFGNRMSVLPLLLLGYTLNSMGNLFTGLAWVIPVAFSMQLIRGVGLSFSDMANSILIQRNAPRHLLGRVFGNMYGAIGIAASLSYTLGGVLLDLTNARVVFVTAGIGGLLSVLFVGLSLPKALREQKLAADSIKEEGAS